MEKVQESYDSVADAAEAIGVTRQTVNAWIKSGKLPATPIRHQRSASGGRPSGWHIKHADLIAARRGTMFDEAPQLRLDANGVASTMDALGLHVVWPATRHHQRFQPSLLAGYTRLRAVTYSVSIPMILKMLVDYGYDDVEVTFGSERLTQATDLADIMACQRSIEEHLTQGFVGMGGSDDPKTQAILDLQATKNIRFWVMSGSIVHTKLYLLESATSHRVLIGSANLSTVAFSGRQGEVLVAFDDDDWMWAAMEHLYDTLRDQATTPLRLEPHIKPASIVGVEDFPPFREAKDGQKPVTLYVQAPRDVPGSDALLAVREEELVATFGPSFRDHIKPAPSGEVVITPAVLHRVKKDVSASKPINQEVHHHLARSLEGRFLYNNAPIDRPTEDEDADRIEQDAFLITRYLNGYREFGYGAEVMQRNYFAVMGWLYFSPFMSHLRRERSALGPGNFDCKPIALLYGPSDCGKTFIVDFLFRSMFGHSPPPLGNKDFTSQKVLDKQSRAGVCPLFYDDVQNQRFTGGGRYGGDGMGETIVKAYDRLHQQLPAIPCLIASLNSESREFGNEVRKRALMVHASTPLAGDDIELKGRLHNEAVQIIERVGTSFYREYLFRMTHRMDHVTDWAMFDYLDESSGLLAQLFTECLRNEETLPKWCRRITKDQYDDFAWEPKRFQMKHRLDNKLYTQNFPPKVGDWTVHNQDIVLGVHDIREIIGTKEIPDHLIRREASTGTNLHLWQTETEAFIARGEGDGDYRLPVPNTFTRLIRRRR